VTPGYDLRYLIGSRAQTFERLTALVVPASGDPVVVVPRLEFTINLVAALPSAVAGPLRQAAAVEGEPPLMLERPLVVNAFAEPQLVKHARVIVERRLAGKTYKEIAKELDMTKDHMRNCARIARLMEDARIPEPYHRLTEKPDRVSQWCSKHWLKAGDRKGGGKRRRAS
jgi:Xaa-Pro aminopeptidase